MDYNDSQLEAIRHKYGPCLVLAGPGSGKTAVLCERLRHLLRDESVNAQEILVITFTKAAAMEMRSRFLTAFTSERAVAEQVNFGTFHAIFFSVLKNEYGFRASSILKEEEKYEIVRDLLTRIPQEMEDSADGIKEIIGEISAAKNSGVMKSQNLTEGNFKVLYDRFVEVVRGRKKLDFDDMLLDTYQLFCRDKRVLKSWQERYKYILVDEFQDINPLQFEIVKMLALPHNNLFVVGDDDQSIYGFRGSNPEIMLNFPKVYPDCKQILLHYNYRSCANIVANGLSVINHNLTRFYKETKAFQSENGDCGLLDFKDTTEEAKSVADRILNNSENTPPEQIAVLFRSNSQMSIFAAAFTEKGLAFASSENIKNVYVHWIAEDLFSFLRLAEDSYLGKYRRRDLLRIMNRPNRYLLRESVDAEYVTQKSWLAFYKDSPNMQRRIIELLEVLQRIRKMSTFAAISYLRRAHKYEEYLADYASFRNQPKEEYLEILEMLAESAKDYPDHGAWMRHVSSMGQMLKERQGRSKEEKAKGVRLMTMHGSKGLEFETVYIADVIESITPFRRAVLPQEIEEERRLFFVAMTRAKKNLYLCVPKDYRNHTSTPSRFLAETQDFHIDEEKN